MAEQEEHSALRPDAVDEVLTTPPGWIVRWGITAIFVFVLTLTALLYFVRYPELVKADVLLLQRQQGYAAVCTVLPAKAAKIRKGQKVNVQLNGYPRAAFGVVEGVVTGVATAEGAGELRVSIFFPRGLQTSFGKKPHMGPRMQGTAEIVTGRTSLLQRIMAGWNSVSKVE